MKRFAGVVVLVAFILNCAPALPHYKYQVYEREKPIVISERVGETIDAEEGAQYGLFTEIRGFKEAKFFSIEKGGYVVEIATEGDNLVGVNRDQDAMMILRECINKHEEISDDRTGFASKWGVLDYDTLGIPITESEVNFAMKQSRSRAVKGGLASCGGSVLVGLLVGFGIAAGSGRNGSDIGPALGAAAGVTVLAVVALIGLVAVGTNIATTYGKNAASFLKAIKEARKPRVVE